MSSSTEARSNVQRVVAALAALILALVGIGVLASPAQAASGDITGHVIDQYTNDVIGLDFTIYDDIGGSYPVTTDPVNGTFFVNVTPTPNNYFYYSFDGEFDALGYGYVQQSVGGYLDVVTGELDFGVIQLDRYENIAGSITNWDPAMTEVTITSSYRATSSDFWSSTGYQVTTLDGNFSVPAILETGEYDLYFAIDPTSRAPYLDAYLGGGLDDIDPADVIHATAGFPEMVTMDMPAAALISGIVTTDGGATPLDGILVVGFQESGSSFHADFATTDVGGLYTLRARPDETYSVHAVDVSGDPDPYADMVFNGFYGCSCQFTPVIPAALPPTVGIDFDMTRESELFFILGELYDTSIATGPELDDIRVHVQHFSLGSWIDVAIAESDSSGFFEVVVPRDDIAYRLVFTDGSTVLRILEGEVGPGSASSPDPAAAGCYLATGAADPSWLDSGVLYYVVLGLNPSGGCSSTPAPPGSPGTQTGSGRTFGGTTAADTSGASPTPTPTPSATPRPTTSPSPSATAAPEVPPASAPDLWWLLWLILAILVIVIVGGVVYFVRRT
jgi:hypothetical protein